VVVSASRILERTKHQELIQSGRVQAAGLKAFQNRDLRKAGAYSFENELRQLDAAYEKEFRAQSEGLGFFSSSIAVLSTCGHLLGHERQEGGNPSEAPGHPDRRFD
jgi:hypothetical protein